MIQLKTVRTVALAAFGAFVVSGPLQYVGALPQTMLGDASKATLKSILDLGSREAFAACGNNGFGNGGFDGVPGLSGAAPGCDGCAADIVR